MGFVLERVENVAEKGEKYCLTSIFSFSHNVFKNLLCLDFLTHSHTMTPIDMCEKETF